MLAVAMLVAAAAPPAQAQPQDVRALVLDLKASSGAEELARAVTSLFAVEIQKDGRFVVLTSADLRTLVEQEASRAELGCDVAAQSCLAEIAGALGADIVFYGDVIRLGELHVVTLNYFDARRARALGRGTLEVRDASDVPRLLREAVPRLLARPPPAAPPTTPAPAGAAATPAPSGGLSPWGWGGVAAVGAGVVGGALAFAWASAMTAIETDPASSRVDKELAFQTHDAAGFIAIGAAVVGVAGAAAVGADLFIE